MLRYRLVHPEILHALAAAGHGSKVLIADGNYPASTGVAAGAARVNLNLAPDQPTVVQVLEVVLDAVAVEAVEVMQPAAPAPEPEIFAEFAQLIPDLDFARLDRFAFYDAARSSDVALVVATGERRFYANILLTLGVV